MERVSNQRVVGYSHGTFCLTQQYCSFYDLYLDMTFSPRRWKDGRRKEEKERETERDSEHQGAHAQKDDGQKEGPVLFSETLEAAYLLTCKI